jgi:hypothetical protein
MLDESLVSRLERGEEVLEEQPDSELLGIIEMLKPLESLDEEFSKLWVENHKLTDAVPRIQRGIERRQANGLGILREVSGVLADLKREIDQRNHHADRGNEFTKVP